MRFHLIEAGSGWGVERRNNSLFSLLMTHDSCGRGGQEGGGKRGRRGEQRRLSVTEQGKWEIIHAFQKSVEAPSAPALLNTVPAVCISHLRDVCLNILWHCILTCLVVYNLPTWGINVGLQGKSWCRSTSF